MDKFATVLLAETLFYDEEFGATGYVSLIDEDRELEVYMCAFIPDEGVFGIDEAVKWEDDDDDADDDENEDEGDVRYLLSTKTKRRASFSTPIEAAEYLISLAREMDLLPSVTLLFEDDVV